MKCRFCNNELKHKCIDLVSSPPSNSFLSKNQLNEPETFYPLKLWVCDKCWLVQIDEFKNATEIFDNEYAYFSSYSKSWLEHSKKYVDMISRKLQLDSDSYAIEIASNDGYLLQYFQEKQIPCLGIEPTSNTAKVAKEKGIDVVEEFFGVSLAKQLNEQGKKADLILGNNVLAHVPDINDFVAGLKIILGPQGIVTMEFPHFMRLVEFNQFDTIYHEHFSYLSLIAVERIFLGHGLEIFDVEELVTHGGSLRIYAKHREDESRVVTTRLKELEKEEISRGIQKLSYYESFQKAADQVKFGVLSFLVEQKKNGKKVVAYGAAAKGNTLLNYCGVKKDLIPFVVDASPHKQGKYLPGSHIPVVSESEIHEIKPDYIIILPWNIKDEVVSQLAYVRDWGGKFVVAIPKVEKF
jgi:2-polyprenyl-3-methyl-5-hydroxy-6-metoxy-1,4-benzoquinol methylase